MFPTGKVSPGICDLVIAGTRPELSVIVGSVQVTAMEVAPRGTTTRMGSGQFDTTGGMVSGSATVKTKWFMELLIFQVSNIEKCACLYSSHTKSIYNTTGHYTGFQDLERLDIRTLHRFPRAGKIEYQDITQVSKRWKD